MASTNHVVLHPPQNATAQAAPRQMCGRFIAAGSAFPVQMVNNRDLANEFGVTSGWIEQRCGIQQRFVANSETATSLAVDAVREALHNCSEMPDLLLCATYSPDRLMAPIAPRIAHLAGLGHVAAFDMNAACSGGVTAVLTALAYISAGLFHNVLVVASDTTTKHLRQSDLKTRMLFSDGAVALLVGPPRKDHPYVRVRSHHFGSDGGKAALFSAEWGCLATARPHVTMDGPALFRFAVEAGIHLLKDLCAEANISADDLGRILIHQANARITRAIQKEFSGRRDLWPCSLDMGNLAAASVLFLLRRELVHANPPFTGLLAVASFGAGLTWAGAILEVSS